MQNVISKLDRTYKISNTASKCTHEFDIMQYCVSPSSPPEALLEQPLHHVRDVILFVTPINHENTYIIYQYIQDRTI